MKNFIKKPISILSILKYLFLTLTVVFICLFFMSKKENLDLDEMYTFGLANSSFQLAVEDFKEYSGEELLLNYTAVKDGNTFDAKNVFFNQKMDTHPPLYYLLVNFVCSLRKGTFSMWYGLIINIFFMVILYFQTSYILSLIIKDKTLSYVLTAISICTYGFINEMVFIRMYVMLSVLSMAFIILIINKLDKLKSNADKDKNDVKFLVKFFLICVLGILTQYHFMIAALFFSIVFGLYLIKIKNTKLLIKTLVSGILSIACSILIFPAMISHLFSGSSMHSLTGSAAINLSQKFFELIKTIYTAFFGVGFIPYIIMIVAIAIIVLLKSKEKVNVKSIIANNSLLFTFLLFIIYYYLFICISVKFTFARYFYNIYPIILVVVISSIYLLLEKIAMPLKYLTILIAIILVITSKLYDVPFSLNGGDSVFMDFLRSKQNTKTILLYRTKDKNGNINTMSGTSLWKLPRPLYTFKDLKNMTFVDISRDDTLIVSDNDSIKDYDDILLVIYTTENDDKYIRELMAKNNVKYSNRIYFTNYFHMYELSN